MFKEEKTLVSILIAAYNEEKYIKRCIESVLHQTYKNIEIIIVNDGSSDQTEQICKEYKGNDNRIKLITQMNLGVSMARQVGLNNASGEFIQFIDSDDWLEPNRTEILVNTILKDKTDIVFSSAFRHRDDGTAVISNIPIQEGIYDIEEIKSLYIKSLFGDMKKDEIVTTGYVWCCLYRRNVLNEIQFYSKITLHEDEILNLQALEKTSTISIIKDPLYNYNRRTNTLSKKNTYWNGYWENMVEVYWAKKQIGDNIFSVDKEYMERLSTAMFQKYFRTIRNETHYLNPSHFWGGLRNLYKLKAENVINEIDKYKSIGEFTFEEKILIYLIKKRILFVPYFYYAIITGRMRNFEEKTKN
ncbi:MAG: glycosyltransferase family 2 protein [Lachnospiraceae bacterium]